MLSLLGSLLGFAGSAAPAVMDHFKTKQNNQLELDKMRLHAELRKEGFDYDMQMFDKQAADKEHERLIALEKKRAPGEGTYGGPLYALGSPACAFVFVFVSNYV